MRLAICTLVSSFALLGGPFAVAQAPQPQAAEPQVLHAAQRSTETAEHSLPSVLARARHESQPIWIAYDIPVVQRIASGYGQNTVADLEEKNGYTTHDDNRTRAGTPGTLHATLLLRLSGGTLTRLRLEPPDRVLDAGGTRFLWLARVSPEESVRELVILVSASANATASPGLEDPLIFAIAQHDAPSATPALTAMIAPGQTFAQQKRAAFWLAAARGPAGLAAIAHATRTDPDPAFRRELTFDLTLPKDNAGLPELIRMAHEDASPDVRRQAQFWMATRGGSKVAGHLRAAIESDPNTDVRKAAVFALTQLPHDQATTQLISVAETSHDPEVRKQAVFWLGQSQDPRALEYLTRLLQP